MNKLMDYVCDELDELEKKVNKEGKLSAAEIEYADKLAHIKKSILTSESLMDGNGYSGMQDTGYFDNGGVSMRGDNYSRNRGNRYYRRDSMGRYSRYNGGGNGNSYAGEDMIEQLESLKQMAPQEVKQDIQRIISKVENM